MNSHGDLHGPTSPGTGADRAHAARQGVLSDVQSTVAPNLTMLGVRDITSEQPTREIWKLLRYFLDEQYAVDHIAQAQTVDRKTQRANLAKQARQLAYCIRQADEYFAASNAVDVPTRPVLLYYGATSLSRALILLRQSGDYSFDRLRELDRHNHHGLELDRAAARDKSKPSGVVGFLSSLRCKCNHHGVSGEPWGNFPLFYRSLVPPTVHTEINVRLVDRNAAIKRSIAQPCVDLGGIDAISSLSLNVLELVQGLPDLYHMLRDFGVQSDLCRGWQRVDVAQQDESQSDGTWLTTSVEYTFNYSLDGITKEQRDTLLPFLTAKNPTIQVASDIGTNLILRSVQLRDRTNLATPLGYSPDVVEDIHGRLYFIVESKRYIVEIAAMLIVLFCFSMLARYYPDIWMERMDRESRTREFVDYFLNICYRKFPNLALDQLTTVKHRVHP